MAPKSTRKLVLPLVLLLSLAGGAALVVPFLTASKQDQTARNLVPVAQKTLLALLSDDVETLYQEGVADLRKTMPASIAADMRKHAMDDSGELSNPVYQSFSDKPIDGEPALTLDFQMSGTLRDARAHVMFAKEDGQWKPFNWTFTPIGKFKKLPIKPQSSL